MSKGKKEFIDGMKKLFEDEVLTSEDFSAEALEYFENLQKNKGGDTMLSEKAIAVLNVLNGAEAPIIGKEIAELAGFESANGVAGIMSGLIRRGLADKTDDTPRMYFSTEEGKNTVVEG